MANSGELSPLGGSCEDSEQQCGLCNEGYKQPRVLACLHVYCEACLEKLLQSKSGDGDCPAPANTSITCPECGHETKLKSKGALRETCPLDHVLANELERAALEGPGAACTSCKAREPAVARCSDCASLLCNNCVTAHRYMRCFESHAVLTFEELGAKPNASGDGSVMAQLHRPLACPSHAGEQLKHFCLTCQVPICSECMVSEHQQPEHRCERASEAGPRQREELEALMAEGRLKATAFEDSLSALQTGLTDLQMQRDNTRSLIQETFQSYKAILEKRQDELLAELENMHSEEELRIMDAFHMVEKTAEQVEVACRFTERLLKHANNLEMLSLKPLVGARLMYLLNNTPKPELQTELVFETESARFEAAVRSSFGHLVYPRSPPTPPPPPPSSSTSSGVGGGISSPLHSAASSLEGTDPFASVLAPPASVSSVSPLEVRADGFLANNVVAQYNLARLAGMAGGGTVGEDDQPHVGSPIVGGAGGGTLADLLMDSGIGTAEQNVLNNLEALAKLGSVSLNSSGQIIVNGQVVPGLTLDSAVQSPLGPSAHHRGSHLVDSLLVNGGALSPRSSSRGSPLLDGLVNGGSLGGPRVPILSANVASSLSVHTGYVPPPRSSSTKLNTMQIRCKFGQLGSGKGQFSSPHGFCLGLEEEIIVADTNNHRIQVFDKTGEFKYTFGVPGKEEGQLWYPRKVAVIKSSGKYVICDRGNERSRMQIFTKGGHFIKKIAIRYIDIVAGLAITAENKIVAVDSVSPTVFVISEAGELLLWFDCSEYMREPSDIAISGREYYICDFKGHCVIVFSEEGQYLRKIGYDGVTNFPNGIDISDAGDVLVGDSHGNRFHVVVFSRDGTLLSEFECPYVKVSRCCGLKITSEGYVVTLAKNNHHVLVLNTLYIV
ncbi:B-box type zinc finger protein ncl-1-like isoform X2 [Ornithodoros turicata]|uniref:B-box type zinc finger protein ncl-1-like isoform X2 n=1 Tax=Ornithodoros turicata TaxID=34597 RepID=UPI00313913FC